MEGDLVVPGSSMGGPSSAAGPERDRVSVLWRGGRPRVFIGGTEIRVDYVTDGEIFAECTLAELERCATKPFPGGLTLRLHHEDGFGTGLFNNLEIRSGRFDVADLTIICHHPNKYWEGHWGLSTFLQKIADLAPHASSFEVSECDLVDDWKRLALRVTTLPGRFGEEIAKSAAELRALISAAEAALVGFVWKSDYRNDERLFCEEVLGPLLRKMGFVDVQYNGGPNEFGKDFTFSELTPFRLLRHYGLQAKAGDVGGGNNSQIDEILGQIKDAFHVPHIAVSSGEKRFISTLVVAISGHFTSNAKQKIVDKMPRGLIGSVYFLDGEKIRELAERYWAPKA